MNTRYKISEPYFMLLDGSSEYAQKTYVVHDAPQATPREKIEQRGPLTLTTPELLSIVLDTGESSVAVRDLSARIVKEYGEKSIMEAIDPVVLSKDLDISLAEASRIVACAELGRRFYKRNTAEAPIIRTPSDVHAYVKDMYDLPKEHLRGIYLNAHYKVIHTETISIGTVDTSIIHPREVFKPALEYAAAAVVLVHNHPSGSTTPSDADIVITNQLVQAGKLLGVELVDHVIVTRSSYASIPPMGIE